MAYNVQIFIYNGCNIAFAFNMHKWLEKAVSICGNNWIVLLYAVCVKSYIYMFLIL